MNITIKRIGTAHGTIGWLHAGLQDGSLRLEEGLRSPDRHHGLWLKNHTGTMSITLGIYDLYGVGDQCEGENCYKSVRNQDTRPAGLTDACWFALLDIGDAWAEQANEDEEQAGKNAPEIKIIRVSLSE